MSIPLDFFFSMPYICTIKEMIMKLISCEDFVLEMRKEFWNRKGLSPAEKDIYRMALVDRYAELLNLELVLGMFVPCDEEGNVLEKPNKEDYGFNPDLSETYIANKPGDLNYGYFYDQAKEKVLFKGFSHEDFYKKTVSLFGLNFKGIFFEDDGLLDTTLGKNLDIVKDLLSYDLELTESAKKQIGL